MTRMGPLCIAVEIFRVRSSTAELQVLAMMAVDTGTGTDTEITAESVVTVAIVAVAEIQVVAEMLAVGVVVAAAVVVGIRRMASAKRARRWMNTGVFCLGVG